LRVARLPCGARPQSSRLAFDNAVGVDGTTLVFPHDLFAYHGPPGPIGVELSGLIGISGRPESAIFFEDYALVIHDEGPDSGHAVLRRPSDQRKSADHFSVHHIVDGMTVGRPLGNQYPEVVAVVWHGLFRVRGQSEAFRDQAVGGSLPVQSVLLTLGAGDLLRVLENPVSVARRGRILDLRLNIAAANLHRVKLITADSTG